MISVVFALLQAMVWMTLWFVRALAIAAGMFILSMLAIAIYAMLHGSNNK